jgi:hypothetical protein
MNIPMSAKLEAWVKGAKKSRIVTVSGTPVQVSIDKPVTLSRFVQLFRIFKKSDIGHLKAVKLTVAGYEYHIPEIEYLYFNR